MKEEVIGKTTVNGNEGEIKGYNLRNEKKNVVSGQTAPYEIKKKIPKGDKRSLFRKALQHIDSIIPKGGGNSYDYLNNMSKITAPTSKAVKDAKEGCKEQKKRGWGESLRKGGR